MGYGWVAKNAVSTCANHFTARITPNDPVGSQPAATPAGYYSKQECPVVLFCKG